MAGEPGYSLPDSIRHVFDALARDANAMLSDLAQLLAVDTSFPPGSGYEAFAVLAETLSQPLGFRARRVCVPETLWNPGDNSVRGERVNLIAERRSGRPACCVYFHVDTVPPGDGWIRSPLALTVEDRVLYGRGAADMKGTIAAMFAALRAMQAAALPLAFDPVLLFCTDEEGGLPAFATLPSRA